MCSSIYIFHKHLLQIYIIIPHCAGNFNAKMLIFYIFLDKNSKNIPKTSFVALFIYKTSPLSRTRLAAKIKKVPSLQGDFLFIKEVEVSFVSNTEDEFLQQNEVAHIEPVVSVQVACLGVISAVVLADDSFSACDDIKSIYCAVHVQVA